MNGLHTRIVAQTKFSRYFYLDKRKLLLPRLALLTLVLLGLYLTFHYLADPSWYPNFGRTRVKGKGAAFAGLLLLLISFPVWLRVPLTLLGLAEAFVYNTAMLIWTFDSRPDFAIGPFGIYGIDYLIPTAY